MKNILTIGSVEYGDEILSGGVDYGIDINGGEELTAGVTACGTIKFDIISAENPFTVGTEFVWSRRQIGDNAPVSMGIFTVTSAQRQNSRFNIEACDRMAKFDVIVDAWLGGISYPVTHSALLNALCARVGVQLDTNTALTNGDRSVPSSPAWEGATGRDILGFIAEASGCFACMTSAGRLSVRWYKGTNIALTKSDYSGPFIADYAVSAIDRVQVRSNQNDIGVVVGNGANTYVIENNPLFAAASDAELRPYAERLLTKLSALTYTPCEVPMYNDKGLRVGDIFTVNGIQSVVMSYRCTERGITVSSSGSEQRPTQSTSKNRDVIALMGKTNELTRTVEETNLRMTNAEGDITTLKVTAEGLSGSISDVDGRVTALSVTVNGFDARITDAENNVASVSATATSLTARVNNAEIAISAIGIQLSGYVTFSSLQTSGQTIINGDNITTGKITGITYESTSADGTNFMRLNAGKLAFWNFAGNYMMGSISAGSTSNDGGMNLHSDNDILIVCDNLYYSTNYATKYRVIHEGNIGAYVGNVYAVFG